MLWTKKDYEDIALIIKQLDVDDGLKLTVARLFAKALGANASFNRKKFLQACSPIGTDFSKGEG